LTFLLKGQHFIIIITFLCTEYVGWNHINCMSCQRTVCEYCIWVHLDLKPPMWIGHKSFKSTAINANVKCLFIECLLSGILYYCLFLCIAPLRAYCYGWLNNSRFVSTVRPNIIIIRIQPRPKNHMGMFRGLCHGMTGLFCWVTFHYEIIQSVIAQFMIVHLTLLMSDGLLIAYNKHLVTIV